MSWQQRDDRDALVHLEQVATVESGLYAVAVLLGVALRLLLLDQRPLSVEEGALASQSYRVMLDHMPNVLRDGPLPTYGVALALLLFGGGDGAARLLSAVAGSALVVTPYLVRDSLGKVAALLAAFGFALSPLLLFASRDVGSGIVPATLSVLLWWAVSRGMKPANTRWAFGIALILSALIACAPAGLTAIIALGVAALLSHPSPASLAGELRRLSAEAVWRRAALLFVASTLAIGAAFGANLPGVQSVLVDVWAGWLGSLSLLSPRGSLPVTIALYETPVLFAALGRLVATIARKQRTDTFLSLWMMILLLLGMLQSPGSLSRVVLPLVPMYLLGARALAGGLPLARGIHMSWRWGVASLGVMVPVLVAVVMLNRASILGQEIPAVFLSGEAALVTCGVLVIFVMLDGRGRSALGWGAATVVGVLFLVHTTFFLNYRLDSAPRELVAGQEITPFLREAATEAAYYSRYFDSTITVDPQLRVPLEWYLRSALNVGYSTANTQGISIQVSRSAQTPVTPTTARRPGLYAPAFDAGEFSLQGVWAWLVAREGLVSPNQRDILLRAPAGDW